MKISVKQQMFLADVTTQILMYGGASGCGKSHTSVLKAINKGKAGGSSLVIVRSYAHLEQHHGIFDEAKDMVKFIAKVDDKTNEITFPSGGKIVFKTKEDYIGSSDTISKGVDLLVLDEVQQYEEEFVASVVTKVIGRNKDAQVVFTANPANNWLKDIISYSLDDNGIPNAGSENVVIDISCSSGKFSKYGDTPYSFRFISATALDNPSLLESAPDYIQSLNQLSKKDRAKYRDGCWNYCE